MIECLVAIGKQKAGFQPLQSKKIPGWQEVDLEASALDKPLNRRLKSKLVVAESLVNREQCQFERERIRPQKPPLTTRALNGS